MARKVQAVLTWLTDTPNEVSTPAAKELGTKVAALLRERFPAELVPVEHSNAGATTAAVRHSLQSAVAGFEAEQDGLLVLAFSGHGSLLPDKQLAWVLHDGKLREDVLYQELDKLPQAVEVVLVMDCCGASEVMPWCHVSQRRWLARIHRRTEAMVLRLSQGARADTPARNVTCFAATNGLLTRRPITDNYFARVLYQVAVPAPPATYALFDAEMKKIKEELDNSDVIVQENWQVVYQPAGAGELVPFRQ